MQGILSRVVWARLGDVHRPRSLIHHALAILLGTSTCCLRAADFQNQVAFEQLDLGTWVLLGGWNMHWNAVPRLCLLTCLWIILTLWLVWSTNSSSHSVNTALHGTDGHFNLEVNQWLRWPSVPWVFSQSKTWNLGDFLLGPAAFPQDKGRVIVSDFHGVHSIVLFGSAKVQPECQHFWWHTMNFGAVENWLKTVLLSLRQNWTTWSSGLFFLGLGLRLSFKAAHTSSVFALPQGRSAQSSSLNLPKFLTSDTLKNLHAIRSHELEVCAVLAFSFVAATSAALP